MAAELKRPKTRGDCCDGPRPCPWVSCRHHLYLWVGYGGVLGISNPEIPPWKMPYSCSLDLAGMGGLSQRDVGTVLAMTTEAVSRIERLGLKKLRERRHLQDWKPSRWDVSFIQNTTTGCAPGSLMEISVLPNNVPHCGQGSKKRVVYGNVTDGKNSFTSLLIYLDQGEGSWA